MTDRVLLRGGSADGHVAELEDASTGATTLYFQDGDEEWGERYIRLAGASEADPATAEQIPVFVCVDGRPV